MGAKSWEREVHILKLVRHENIVSIRVIYESDNHVYMVMELCDGGTLNAELSRRGRFKEPETVELMRQLCRAVDYLHRRNIVHRDVKLENLLIQHRHGPGPRPVGCVLTRDQSEVEKSHNGDSTNQLLPFRIKLTDFGLSIELKRSQETMQEFCGTPLFMAPEIIAGKSYSCQCDVWSMGIIMHLLLTGVSPFRANTEEDLYEEIREWDSVQLEKSRNLQSLASPQAVLLLSRLLHREPMYRFTSKEALRQPWFSGKTEDFEGGTTTNILELMKEYHRSKENGEARTTTTNSSSTSTLMSSVSASASTLPVPLSSETASSNSQKRSSKETVPVRKRVPHHPAARRSHDTAVSGKK